MDFYFLSILLTLPALILSQRSPFGPAIHQELPECNPGDNKSGTDGCNKCHCYNGMWVCTEMACFKGPFNYSPEKRYVRSTGGLECSDGDTKIADQGCNNICTCANGRWACPKKGCPIKPSECSPGDTKIADDGCNDCTCMNGAWVCTMKDCPPKPSESCTIKKPCLNRGGHCTTDQSSCEASGGLVKPGMCSGKACVCCIPTNPPPESCIVKMSCLNRGGHCTTDQRSCEASGGMVRPSMCSGKACVCCIPTNPPPECEDKVVNCQSLLLASARCDDDVMQKFCKKTCGLCVEEEINGPSGRDFRIKG